MPIAQVRKILEQELGPRASDLLDELEVEPLAAASIGQVHRSRLPSGERVAVKVQYAEVERAIESDFRPAAIGTGISAIVYPGAKIDELIGEARARLLEECDYLHEAAAQDRFAELYRGHPVIAVPDVHDAYCSRKVLTSTWLEGIAFDAFIGTNPTQSMRDRIGEALFDFYVGSLFKHALYNCDPHPGNYLILDDGRVGMIDYGCTRQFEQSFVAQLAKLTRAVHSDEHDLLHRAFLDLGMVRDGQSYDFDTARDLVRAFYGPMLRDAVQAIDLGEAIGMRRVFARKRQLLKLRLPGEFLFLFRIRFGLMSVLEKLGARANWYQLEQRWIEAIAK
jgi:predicted unusual protein kinase regulating ubiquinone biosynthesis (AarF/ABC1/UbiB family)